ncbi:hypothetical protein NDU88_003643 [Pleurodeles waltl]|uniref:Uncharacterized protein n=1 Tax=Pleurodeles waltl TaxID=8319 RepID=A0AAV7W5Z3_PLEWA|nr:hypothetical protein NDU88_003643 [Pleurodeles waltl]
MHVLDFPDDMDDELTNISQQTLQDVLGTLRTLPSVARRCTDTSAITEDPPTTSIARPASSNLAEDSDDTGTSFERTVVGVQRELAKEMWVGMENMATSLEDVCSCMISTAEHGGASILQELEKSVKEISTAVRELTQHLQQQTFQRVHKCKIDPLRADLAAYHSDAAAILNILKNLQLLLAAVLPLIAPQLSANGMSDSSSSNTKVCGAPSHPPPPRAEETTHTSEDEDVEQITFTCKSTR